VAAFTVAFEVTASEGEITETEAELIVSALPLTTPVLIVSVLAVTVVFEVTASVGDAIVATVELMKALAPEITVL
jgi:hypothetical protein